MRPQYIERFRCIAAECEDSCCDGWTVAIDKPTYRKYKKIPPGPLRDLLDANVLLTPRSADGSEGHPYASMQMPPSLICPMHNEEKLCQIQAELGAEYLSRICRDFPRASFTIDNLEETTLTLSCPEAARIVLSSDDALGMRTAEPLYQTREDEPDGRVDLLYHFWPIREFTVNLLLNRNYLLWHRLFLLGSFSKRLQQEFEKGSKANVNALLRGYVHAVSVGSLRNSIETMPVNLPLQLRMVSELASMQAAAGIKAPRLQACFDRFMDGIGRAEDTPFEAQCQAYATAYQSFYAPFFAKHPHMLENLLLNMIFRNMFPYGPNILKADLRASPMKQYADLAIEFSLIKGMLIGVASRHKEAFSVEDVVETVQVVIKHFEHNRQFLEKAQEMLTSMGLNDAPGHTMLLRN